MVRRAVLALIASAAVFYAVGSVSLGETPKEATIAGAGTTTSPVPALPTYQPPALFPLKETGQTFNRAETQRVFFHDAIAFDPMWAAILDPGFTIPVPAPPPEPLVSAAGALTEAQFNDVLDSAGWPEHLWGEARAIVRCESNFRPDALGDGGRSGGLFQLNIATWFRYAGEDASLWHDPLVNARTAWATYNYDLRRGYVPWKQWSCRKVLY